MIKTVFPLHRLPNLSREQFQAYWFETHAPLVPQHAESLGIKRYVQIHTLSTPINEALRDSREGPEPYDGIAELWFESDPRSLLRCRRPKGSRQGARSSRTNAASSTSKDRPCGSARNASS
jgi:hypothetical protein